MVMMITSIIRSKENLTFIDTVEHHFGSKTTLLPISKPERERTMNLKQFLIDNPDVKKFWLSSMEMCVECRSDDADMFELFGDRIILSVERGNIAMIYIL